MNNTLTGLGVALVVALLAALVGPWFVNWTAYRDDFASQASAIVGAPVTLSGAVEARLLPSPYVRFRGLSAGAGEAALSIDEVEIELAVAPLLRGEFKANEVRLVRPRLGAEMQADGTVRTAFPEGRRAGFAAGRASFERAEIVDGTVSVATPAGRLALAHVSGLAEAGSLAGPFKFEGDADLSGERLRLRLSTARVDAAGALRLKLAVEREGRFETIDIEGAVRIAARPGFEGRVAIVHTPPRPKGAPAGPSAGEPWRIAADVKGDGAQVRASGLDLSFGPDDRALRLGGRGELTVAARPSFALELESRQIDFDRAAGEGSARTPAAMLQAIVERVGFADRPRLDGKLSLDVRGVVLAGDVVRDVAAELAAHDGAWRIDRASAVMPGETVLTASDGAASTGPEPGFSGKGDFSTRDLASFRRWLTGRQDAGATLARRVTVKGDIAARPGSIAIDQAEFSADGARSTGRLSWTAGTRGRLDAALRSDALDLDALGLEPLLSAALKGGQTDVTLALEARALRFGGVRMNGVSIDGALDETGIDVRRLDIRDAAGAAISGSGRIAPGVDGPAGALGLKVAAPDVAPLIALARAAGAPEDALDLAERRAASLSPVAFDLTVEADAKGRRLAAAGDAAGGRLDARVSIGEFSLDAPLEIDVRLSSPDGNRLAAIAGLALSPAAEAPGGEIGFRLTGKPSTGMTGEGRFAALGLDVSFTGAAAVAPVVGLSAQGDIALESADLTTFGEAVGRLTPGAAPPAPASLIARVTLTGEAAQIEDIGGHVMGRPVAGRLTAPFDPAKPFEGALSLEEVPATAVLSLALSPDAFSGERALESWPATPFGPSPARGLAGRIDVTAKRMPLAGGRVATDAGFTLAFRRNAVAVEALSAALAGGRLTGAATVTRAEGEAAVTVALRLDGARAERLADGRPEQAPVVGGLEVAFEAQGSGRSLAGVRGALTGAGTATLTGGAIRGLDVAAIDRVEPQVEAGLPLEAPKIADAVERGLDKGEFRIERAVAPFTISAGTVRTGEITSETADARLKGAASLDLRGLVLDADLTLQPNRPDAGQVGVSFDGPVSALKRRVDATGFTGFLSVRAVERETRRIEAMEADMRERAKIARQRAEAERKRLEEEKKRAEEERRKAEAERRKRDAEARALIETLPRPSRAPALPSTLDISPPAGAGLTESPPRLPAGAFAPPGAQRRATETGRTGEPGRAGDRQRPVEPDALSGPQSILPPPAALPLGR